MIKKVTRIKRVILEGSYGSKQKAKDYLKDNEYRLTSNLRVGTKRKQKYRITGEKDVNG